MRPEVPRKRGRTTAPAAAARSCSAVLRRITPLPTAHRRASPPPAGPRLRRTGVPSYNAAVIPPREIALVFDMDNTVLGSHIDFAAIRRTLGAMLRETGATDESDEALRRLAI